VSRLQTLIQPHPPSLQRRGVAPSSLRISLGGCRCGPLRLGISFRGRSRCSLRLRISFRGCRCCSLRLRISFRGRSRCSLWLRISFRGYSCCSLWLRVTFRGCRFCSLRLGISFGGWCSCLLTWGHSSCLRWTRGRGVTLHTRRGAWTCATWGLCCSCCRRGTCGRLISLGRLVFPQPCCGQGGDDVA